MQTKPSAHLDLGCGASPRNPYGRSLLYGIDIRDDLDGYKQDNFIITKADLALEKIPFEDNFFSSVSAFDFLEHIPRQIYIDREQKIIYPFIQLMNEIWRVLAPGGIFLASTPGYPSAAAFADPTHVNFITDTTHQYFCSNTPSGRMYEFHGEFIAHIAKFTDTLNVEKMPQVLWRSRIRDFSRKFSKTGLQHIVWEFEAVK